MQKQNNLKFRTTIKPSLSRRILFKGVAKAAAGAALFIFGGVFLPVGSLSHWGIFLFLIGIGLIGWGLYPYKKLMNLEVKPYEIIIDEDSRMLCYNNKEKPILSIPLDSIEKLSYFEGLENYGILIHLKTSSSLKVALHDLSGRGIRLPKGCLKQDEKMLFLPYFSMRTFQELKTYASQNIA